MKTRVTLALVLFSGICCRHSTENFDDTRHLRYFGFAITDCGTDYFSQVRSFVNLTDLCLTDFGSIRSRVDEKSIEGKKVLIHLDPLFVEQVADSSVTGGTKMELSADYADQFATWVTNNKDVNLSAIAAVTVADEPILNHLPLADLYKICALVKQAFPSIAILVVESPETVNQLQLNDDINWVSFDRYGTLDPKTDSTYLSKLNALKKARTNPTQKLVLIMESQWLDLYSQAGHTKGELIPMAQSYYSLASSDTAVVALISYLLPDHFDSPDQEGFLSLPDSVKLAIQLIGEKIVR